MRASGIWFVNNLRRLASVLATLIITVAFAMVTSVVNAAPPVKKNNEGKAKIEKIEKIEKEEEVEAEEEAEAEEAEAEAEEEAAELEAEFLGR